MLFHSQNRSTVQSQGRWLPLCFFCPIFCDFWMVVDEELGLWSVLEKGFQSQEGGRCGDERGVCVVIFAIRLNWMETKKLICLWGWNFVHSVVWWFFFVAQIQGVSDIEGAKDIITKMLVVLPECRITIPQVLEHDWFQVWLAPSLIFVFFFFSPHKLNETPLPKLAKVGTKWAFLLFFSVMESKKANFFYSDFVVLF